MEQHQHSITKPIINCHTHIFTGDHVPPYLAKTFLIWPFYYLLNLTFIVKIFRWWYRGPDTIKYKGGFKQLLGWRNRLHILSTRLPGFVKFLAGLFITVQVIFILYDWIAAIVPPEESKLLGWFSIIRTWLADHYAFAYK